MNYLPIFGGYCLFLSSVCMFDCLPVLFLRTKCQGAEDPVWSFQKGDVMCIYCHSIFTFHKVGAGTATNKPCLSASQLFGPDPRDIKVKVTQSCLILYDPMDYTVYGILQVRILEWVAFPFPTQGSNPGLPHCRQILYQLSHKGSPRILEWVAYPFLQQIFPTQELNWGLLHCRQILYQLSYQKSPVDRRVLIKYM